MTDPGAPLVHKVSGWMDFEGLLPALGLVCLFVSRVRGVVAPVARLPFGSSVPHHAHCLVFMGKTVE